MNSTKDNIRRAKEIAKRYGLQNNEKYVARIARRLSGIPGKNTGNKINRINKEKKTIDTPKPENRSNKLIPNKRIINVGSGYVRREGNEYINSEGDVLPIADYQASDVRQNNQIRKKYPLNNQAGLTWIGNTSTSTMNMSEDLDILPTKLRSGSKLEYERSWLVPNKAVILSNSEASNVCYRYWLSISPEKRIVFKPTTRQRYLVEKSESGNGRLETKTMLTTKEFNKLKRSAICSDKLTVYDSPDGNIALLRKFPNGREILTVEKEFNSKTDADNFVIPVYGIDITNNPKYRGKTLAWNNRKKK